MKKKNYGGKKKRKEKKKKKKEAKKFMRTPLLEGRGVGGREDAPTAYGGARRLLGCFCHMEEKENAVEQWLADRVWKREPSWASLS